MSEPLPGWEARLKTFCDDRAGFFGRFARHPEEWRGAALGGDKCARCGIGLSFGGGGFDAYVPACEECEPAIRAKEKEFDDAGTPNYDGVNGEPSRSKVDMSPRGIAKRVAMGLAVAGAYVLGNMVANKIKGGKAKKVVKKNAKKKKATRKERK